MDKEINGHLYIANDNLKRIADALEEIIRLVKEDQEKMRKINEEPEKED
jgi:proteasome assembly chaperone (PAC2) family protein